MQGKIPIEDAASISKRRKTPMVVIFAIEESGDRFSVTSYGRTKALCRLAASYANAIADKVMNCEIVAHQEEPKHLPDEPMIWQQK